MTLTARLQAARARRARFQSLGLTAEAAAARRQIASLESLIARRIAERAA